jgi:hypothetical protein
MAPNAINLDPKNGNGAAGPQRRPDDLCPILPTKEIPNYVEYARRA